MFHVWCILIMTACLTLFGQTASAGEPVFDSSVTERPASSKPFWIDQTVFVVDQTLYVVGIGSHAPTLEAARQKSIEAAKSELAGVALKYRITDAQQALTKEIYDERDADGTYTTYRLLSLTIHDYGIVLVDPAHAQTIAAILAKIEADKAQADETRNQSRAEYQRAKNRAKILGRTSEDDIIWLKEDERTCEREAAPTLKGAVNKQEACERLQKADILLALESHEQEKRFQAQQEKAAEIAKLCPSESAPGWKFWLNQHDRDQWSAERLKECKTEHGLW